MKDITKYTPWILLLCGIVLLVPKINSWLAGLTPNQPYIQIVLGAIAIILALLSLKK